METEHIDHILEQWGQVRPDLDIRPMATIGRILLAADHLQQRMQVVFSRRGLSMGLFDVLASLRRVGPPYQLSPTQLYRELLISSGAITYRLDHLEQLGFIERSPDPADRRGLLVRLTEAGQTWVDQVLEEHLENERILLSGLTTQEQNEVARLLAKLLTSLETIASPQPDYDETSK